ncbi:MBL fold metallo-hydrolase [Archaeoglobus sulfaticallidus]|nr:MBL fold metallo-hydrolase [Archaeoglobus sulfaticallidus]
MKILEVSDELYLIDLPHERKGFRKFISTWVFKSNKKAFLVDVGTTKTVKLLVEALKYLGVEDVEFILLTHIHIDHAGGLGSFLEYYPNAKVVVHDKGKKHLINPERLWEGSLKVLGDIARMYGGIKPVPEKNIYEGDVEFEGTEVEVIATPGHAPHHNCYIYDRYIFVGEAIGVHHYLKTWDFYLRPATPPKFVYEVARESIEKIHDSGNFTACFGHFGYEEDSRKMAELAMDQMDLWVEVVQEIACKKGYRDEKEIIELSREELTKKDNLFSKISYLDEDIMDREDYFVNNTLSGIVGYVKERFCPD